MIRLLHSIGGLTLAAALSVGTAAALAQGNPKNGLYIADAAGCVGCHTDSRPGSAPFAGGRALDTPFGTFYGPNITPDPQTGLAKWSEQDFRRAIRLG